jgi:cation:H+ antiporter
MLDPGSIPPEVAKARAASAAWTFPGVLLASFVIGWGAEAAQFLVSQGLALAMLAWLQTLPEFAVEAVIAWHRDVPLMTANFTGSLRLLTGVAWPMIFFVSFFSLKGDRKVGITKHRVVLEGEHAVSVVALLPPLLYFTVIWAKGSLTLLDSVLLLFLYGLYLFALRKIPPEDSESLEELPKVPRMVLALPGRWRGVGVLGLFAIGGVLLWFITPTFLDSMLGLSVMLGVTPFVFVQWVSPFLSEFPEKVTAFAWARTPNKAAMALINMVSSNINQWTVLAAMIPMVYCASLGHVEGIPFDAHQRSEILLTLAQGYLGFLLLVNMEFDWIEAIGLFGLWFLQFAVPDSRHVVTAIYFAWCAWEILRRMTGKRAWTAFTLFPELWKHGRSSHVRG